MIVVLIVLAVLTSIGFVIYLDNKQGFEKEVEPSEQDIKIDELQKFSEKISTAFNQNAESYNRTKDTILDELKGIKRWTDDAVKLINDNADDVKELQENLIVMKHTLQRIEKEVYKSSNRNSFRKRVIISNKH